MNITMAVFKDGDNCNIFADKFAKEPTKFSESAKSATFVRRPMFARDTGEFGPLLTIPLADAKKMAEEILAL